MYKVTIENMNLNQIAHSGQCFRWNKIQENTYSIIAFDNYIEITQRENTFSLSCSQEEWNTIWCNYFDIGTDYENIKKRILHTKDSYLCNAYKYGSGVRILRQDLWEIIVSFMISQNNNISRITNSIQALCEACALPVKSINATKTTANNSSANSLLQHCYRFPKPGEVTKDILLDKKLGLGYRAEYINQMYEYVACRPYFLEELRQMSYEDAMVCLMEHKGIGKKVANCICLFGLHHIDAFPIDTHMKKILDAHYPDGFDYIQYKGIAGVVQQYMFYYELHQKTNTHKQSLLHS